jgi:hypothetical protein
VITMRAFVLFTSTLLASVLLRITWIANPYTFGGDESTYLVVAGRLLHGEVPYTTTFDNKPPLAELPQAISILVFGNSMVGVRIGAAIVLGIAAFLLSSAAFSTRFTWLRLPTAITIICTYTLIDQGAAWQAELNAILFFSLAAWSFTKRHSPYLIALFAGVIPLCRTNWILVTAVIVVFAILMPRPRPSRGIWLALLGLITPAASVVFVYLVLGKFDRLLQGAVILPMMRQEAGTFGLPFKWDKYLAASLLVLVFAIVLSSVLQQKKERFTDLYFLATMLALTVMALIQSPDFDHHSLQIVAFLPVALARLSLAASSTTRIRSNSRAKWLRFVAFIAGLTIWITPAYFSYQLVQKQILDTDSAASTVATSEDRVQYLLGLPNIKALSLWQIGGPDLLFRLDKAPISPLASEACLQSNPSIRALFYGADPGDISSFRDLLNMNPDIVVIDWLGCTSEADQALLSQYLSDCYQPLGNSEFKMWMRKQA